MIRKNKLLFINGEEECFHSYGNTMDVRRTERKKRILRFIEALMILLFVVFFALIVRQFIGERTIAGEEEEAERLRQSLSPAVPAADGEIPEIQPEIAGLMRKNPDAVGLLHYDGDRTLYVCQGTDNDYYRTHRFDGSEDPAGMIFMDCRCSLLPRSGNLILYGHNMKNGSRFGTLKRFEKAEHLIEFPIFQLAERYETVDYVPIAVFHTTADPDDDAYFAFDQIDFADAAAFDRYIAEVKSRSVVDIPAGATYGDRLVTLATCHSGQVHGRLVVVCREVKSLKE